MPLRPWVLIGRARLARQQQRNLERVLKELPAPWSALVGKVAIEPQPEARRAPTPPMLEGVRADNLWGVHQLTCRALHPPAATGNRLHLLADFECVCGLAFRVPHLTSAPHGLEVGQTYPGCFLSLDHQERYRRHVGLLRKEDIGQLCLVARDCALQELFVGDFVELSNSHRNYGLLGQVLGVSQSTSDTCPMLDTWSHSRLAIVTSEGPYYGESGQDWFKLEPTDPRAQTLARAIANGEVPHVRTYG